jgi:hypothetical protein
MTDFADWLAKNDTLETTEAPTSRAPLAAGPYAEPEFSEPCKKCRGTGRFIGYTGRALGQCFACKGAGKRVFKTSPEARQANKDRAHARHTAKIEGFVRTYPQEMEWMRAKAPTFGFAGNMLQAVMQYGELTERQLATVQRLMAQDAERQVQRKAEAEARAASAPQVSIAAIETAFATAKDNGVKYPKLRLADFTFSPAGAASKNVGAIYVKQGGEYLGKVQDGKFLRVRACAAETEAKVVEVCADPKQAAIAYGKRFGACAVCGRELTNEGSIDAGIGPVCASKYGW